MEKIKIHVLHTGKVCVAPELPFGGDKCSVLKASGIFGKKTDRIWLPVSCYYIEHPRGKILVDTGWNRSMSPAGRVDRKAQIKSLGSLLLYRVNQGIVESNQAIDEQLFSMGVKTKELDFVLITHLDCDHANGLELVKDAKKILVSEDEMNFASKNRRVRYKRRWWDKVNLETFTWNDNEGPAQKSFDIFGDGSVKLINIPGHSDGLFAVKVSNDSGKYVLLFSDGGYAEKSWNEMITSGIAADKSQQKLSLQWIREQSLDERCVESLANHDPNVIPHIIEL